MLLELGKVWSILFGIVSAVSDSFTIFTKFKKIIQFKKYLGGTLGRIIKEGYKIGIIIPENIIEYILNLVSSLELIRKLASGVFGSVFTMIRAFWSYLIGDVIGGLKMVVFGWKYNGTIITRKNWFSAKDYNSLRY